METINIDTTIVMSACEGEYSWRGAARTPPDEDATINVTTGKSHVGCIISNECSWRVVLTKDESCIGLRINRRTLCA